MSTRLVVVRHGETQWNVASRIQGHGDSALTATGEAQARAIAARLAGENLDRLVSSDLGRAWHTARAIAERTGLAPVADARFRERNYGVAEGLTYAEIEVRYPDVFARVRGADPDYAVPGGESRRQLYERVSAAFEALAREAPDSTVVVVCHGGVLAALYRHVRAIALDAQQAIAIPNAAFNALVFDDGRWQVEAWADTRHFGEVAPLSEL